MDEHVKLVGQPNNTPITLSGVQARFLEELSDEAFWNYAFEVAQAIPSPPTEPDTYILCEPGNERYLLPLDLLQEVVSAPHNYTILPDAPAWMLGLAAWRGEVIAVIDLTTYLVSINGVSCTVPSSADGVVLAAHLNGYTFGLYVSAIGGTMTVDKRQILPLEQQVKGVGMSAELYDRLLGSYAEAWVLDMQAIIRHIVQQIDVLAS
jgi:chemotaxis signal transduction protein